MVFAGNKVEISKSIWKLKNYSNEKRTKNTQNPSNSTVTSQIKKLPLLRSIHCCNFSLYTFSLSWKKRRCLFDLHMQTLSQRNWLLLHTISDFTRWSSGFTPLHLSLTVNTNPTTQSQNERTLQINKKKKEVGGYEWTSLWWLRRAST